MDSTSPNNLLAYSPFSYDLHQASAANLGEFFGQEHSVDPQFA